MGTGVVAILWIIFGTIAAFVGMLILRGLTSAFTRKVTAGRKKIMRAATAFPFVCLAWCVAVFVFQWSVNENIFHRDPGIGDAWKCPLPNGYAMLMIDVPDSGWVYRPGTQPFSEVVGEQQDTICCIRVLQVGNEYMAGGIDTRLRRGPGTDKTEIDSYFLLHSVTGERADFVTLDELRTAAVSLGISLALEPIGRVYARYRYTWFDVLAAALFCAPPLLGMVLLGVWIVKLRKDAMVISTPEAASRP